MFTGFVKPSRKVIRTYKDPPVQFDYTTFRKRVRFMGGPKFSLNLGIVSLKGVDLTNAVFHNVEWLKRGFIWKRNVIVDELRLDYTDADNFDEVSGIYNQLRKNFEANHFYDDASDFYVGNMETIRKKLSRSEVWERKLTRTEVPEKELKKARGLKGRELTGKELKEMVSKRRRSLKGQGLRDRFKAAVYWTYKLLNQYGESTFVPLLVWSPLIIAIFVLIRVYFGHYDPKTEGSWLDWVYNKSIDSLFAYFQFPRDNDSFWGTVERIVSAPILVIALRSFALTKRFETAIR
jgi:hypothetical protein